MQKYQPLKRGRPLGAKTFDPIPAHAFGTAVRKIRLEIGMSQEELANLAQVERSHMGKIERGEHMPNLVLILRVSEALSVSPGDLLNKTVALMSDS